MAAITWDVSAQGLVPVARSHAELIAGGVAVVVEGRLEQGAALLSTMTLSSFAGLAVAMIPWLIRGGSLALHQPFDADSFLAQIDATAFDAMIVPGPLASQLAEAGRLTVSDIDVIGVWRAPERLSRASPWRAPTAQMIDVQVFGEAALIAACRGADGMPAAIPLGTVYAPRDPQGTLVVAELTATTNRTLALRGPMVPRVPFPPDAERSELPYFKVAANGFVDTGYTCRPGGPNLTVTAPPPGLVGIGGYRFVERELKDLVGHVGNGDGTLAVLPDAFAGHRLAGIAVDHDTVETALAQHGANPLLVGAFRKRRRPAA